MWYDKLKIMKEKSGLTTDMISERSGVPIGTLNKIFAGQTKDPKLDTITSIVRCFGYTLDDLSDKPQTNIAINNTFPLGTIHNIKVIGRVAAGKGGIAQLEPLGYEIATDMKNPEEYVYFKVRGNSMYPNIMDGDLALVHLQPEVENGEIGVVVVDGEEGIIKKIQKHDGAISLVSFNPEFPPRLVMGEKLNDFYIFGKVVKTTRNY